MDIMLNYDFKKAFSSILEVAFDPASNPLVAILIFGSIACILAIIVALAILALLGGDEEDEDDDDDDAQAESLLERRQREKALRQAAPQKPRSKAAMFVSAALPIVAVIAIWLGAGLVTSLPGTCNSCHVDTLHSKAVEGNPHAETGCVSCHESGGIAGSLTYAVPARAVHFAAGFVARDQAQGYGSPVSSVNCVRCHGDSVTETILIEDRGVRVSHLEPLAAGATCVDCHVPISGTVSSQTVGMSACLRCHDGSQRSAECDSCHIEETAHAVKASTQRTQDDARDLIEQPDCGGCHSQTTCDSCHGLRLPHTQEFMAVGHAREGVKDLWFNDGKTCAKCHYEGHNPCSSCHQSLPSHGKGWIQAHKQGSADGCSCHDKKAYIYGRNICELCHASGTGK